MIRRSRRERRGLLEQLESREMLACSPLDALPPATAAGVTASTAVGAAVGAGVAARAGVAAAVAGDDFGNTVAAATPIVLAANGAGSQSGAIETALDVDMFSIVAPVTGRMTLTESAASGSRLDSYLYVYDSAGRLLARNDDFGRSLNSRIDLNVSAGTKYLVKAAAFSRSTGAYNLQITTAGSTTSPPDTGAFQIDVTMTGFTAAQQQTVQNAVDRWEQIIVGDLPGVAYRGAVIDDLQIAISAIRIDGVGNTLGQASATAYRSGSGLPYLGFIQLDTADVAAMQANGSLQGVLEHEIGHVLGIGVIWSSLGLLTGAATTRPGFAGARAVAEYNALFGTNATAVPVESGGGAGTRLSHWSESVFANELMSGWYNSGQANPISRITVASMADMGYTVNLAAADSYTRPAGVRAAGVAASSAAAALVADQFAADWSLWAADRRHAVDRVMSQQTWRG